MLSVSRYGSTRILGALRKALGAKKVIGDEEIVSLYSREPAGLEPPEKPIAVVFPEDISDLSVLARIAYRMEFPLYPQGSTTSLSGSAYPLEGGVIVSMERMRRIREVSLVDSYALVEAGVRIDDLNVELAKYGYMFPVDPASSAVATVGGAINSGAGGMRGAKYGTMRDWVLGLDIVLVDESGTSMMIGCKTLKCRQGYDLVRLVVGSEGTLALVADAYLKIIPLPENVVTAVAFYNRLEDLMETVVEIKSRGIQPYIMEFMDSKSVSLALSYVESPINASGNMLLVSVDVNKEASGRVLEELSSIMSRKASALYKALSLEEAEEKGLFQIRRSLFPAQTEHARKSIGKDRVLVVIEDIAVPPSKLVDAVTLIRDISERYGFDVTIGGHVGDGNLHPSIGVDPEDPEMTRRAREWFTEVMRIAVRLGGTISAEHGIGTLKKEGLRMELEAHGALKALEIMRSIKKAFDPKGLLNPGKIF
jgi:glycolate oxidase